MIWDLGFGIWDLGFGIWDLGFGIWDLGFGIWDLGFGIWDLGFGNVSTQSSCFAISNFKFEIFRLRIAEFLFWI
jgi:hypothetical protein